MEKNPSTNEQASTPGTSASGGGPIDGGGSSGVQPPADANSPDPDQTPATPLVGIVGKESSRPSTTQQELAGDTPGARTELLAEIEAAIKRYRYLRTRNSVLQWSVLLPVTVAGFFTTAAGGVGTGEIANAWYATPSALTAWGLIAAIGSLIIQTANPAQMAEACENRKDAMRAIRTALKFRNLDIAVAAELVELARSDPKRAIDDLAKQKNGAG